MSRRRQAARAARIEKREVERWQDGQARLWSKVDNWWASAITALPLSNVTDQPADVIERLLRESYKDSGNPDQIYFWHHCYDQKSWNGIEHPIMPWSSPEAAEQALIAAAIRVGDQAIKTWLRHLLRGCESANLLDN